MPPEQSLQLRSFFLKPQTLEHDLGHAVPQKSAHVTSILEFITQHGTAPEPAAPVSTAAGLPQQAQTSSGGQPLPAEQAEELEALQAIFMDELEVSRDIVPALFGINLGGTAAEGVDPRPSHKYRFVFAFTFCMLLSLFYFSSKPHMHTV